MGPRFFNRGKPENGGDREMSDDASMGPRFFNRGKGLDPLTTGIIGTQASMGPRFFNRGKEFP